MLFVILYSDLGTIGQAPLSLAWIFNVLTDSMLVA